ARGGTDAGCRAPAAGGRTPRPGGRQTRPDHDRIRARVGDRHRQERYSPGCRRGTPRDSRVACRSRCRRTGTRAVRRQCEPQEHHRAARGAGARRRARGWRIARSRELGRACAQRRGLAIIRRRMYGFLVGVLILDSLVLATAILLQAGQGGGLASLGGGAGTEQFMGGRQATTLLTRLTWWSAGIFLFLSLVFTTNLSGYQEVFTDPSYLGQIVVMTAPMIGNYGINPDDIESDRPRVAGVVVRELSLKPSNWRSTGALADWLAEARVPIVADV